MTRFVVATATAGLLAALAAAAPSAKRQAAPRFEIDWISWSPGPKIVFDAGGTFAIEPAGTPRRLFTGHLANPVWSPSGRLLALSSGEGRIVVASPTGKPLRTVTRDGHFPSWSPTGHALAFQTGLNRPEAIWTVGTDGKRERRLTSLRLGVDYVRGPTWSPDGAWLAFGACLRAVPEGQDCGERSRGIGVFTIRADGTKRRRVAYGRCPDWSPARQISFLANESIRVVNRDGSARRTVIPRAESCPVWSRDGRSVAAAGERSLLVAVSAPWRVRRVGRLPPLPTSCACPAPPGPAWSPDSRWIAVARAVEGRPARFSYRLYVVRVRDGRTRLLLKTPYF